MKSYTKKLSALLIVCLTTISHVYSQKSSTDCTVPCHTLRNALKTKVELSSAVQTISILRDSVKKMDTIIYQQDTLLVSKKTEISNLNQKVKYSDSCATENKTRAEFYKSEYDVQVRNKWIAIILGSVTTLCSLIFF